MPAIQTMEKANPDTIWALIQENSLAIRELRESQKETDRQMKETDRQMKETDRQIKETDRIVKNNAQLIGKLGGRFGEMVEYMVMPNLINKFRELGFVFTKAYQQAAIKDDKNNIITEIDITLENGEKVMVVEVKTKPTTEDVIEHVERMEKIRAHADLHNDKRIFLGAVAGMVFNDNEKAFAIKKGFYVIEPTGGEPSPLCGSAGNTGETFIITAPQGKPKEW